MCQNLIYCAGNGRALMPKQVALGMAVRRITGRTDLINMLWKFGHTVSTSKLQEIESAICDLRQYEGEGQVPSNTCICKHVPVSFVFENNNLAEETPTGKGTTYCTNGIILQHRVSTWAPPVQRHKQATHHRSSTYVLEVPSGVSTCSEKWTKTNPQRSQVVN